MGQWSIENRAWQEVLTHSCDHLRNGDTNQILRQDIGGGYIRCDRCGETYLPEATPGNTRLLLRIQAGEAVEAAPTRTTAAPTGETARR